MLMDFIFLVVGVLFLVALFFGAIFILSYVFLLLTQRLRNSTSTSISKQSYRRPISKDSATSPDISPERS